MVYKVNNLCEGCGSCYAVCPSEAIDLTLQGKAKIDVTKCCECGCCVVECPVGGITRDVG
jgi:ferredoxin